MLLKKQSIALLLMASISTASYADWGALLKGVLSDDETSTSASSTTASSLDANTIISGLKEALEVGTRKAVEQVSQQDGYLTNELIKIAMPPKLQQASSLMKKFGMGSLAQEFEQSLNRAAESAAPQATDIIVNAVKDMSIKDANAILTGSDDAATQYFKDKTSDQLTSLFRPNIETSLNKVGSTKYYNDLTSQIADIPMVGEQINMDLPDYVTTQALNGLFTVIAQEEKKIRENPVARTTDLLKQVFSK